MGTIRNPQLSLFVKASARLFGDLTGYLILTDNRAVAVNGTAALVIDLAPDTVPVPFIGNAVPASVVRALDQLPRIVTLTVENTGTGQWLSAVCEGGISVDFALPESGSKTLKIANRLLAAAGQPAVEELGSRKLAEFGNGWHFGEFSFLKTVLKPVLETVKTVHPLAPKSTLVTADIALASELVSPKPVAVLRLKVSTFTALVLPATVN